MPSVFRLLLWTAVILAPGGVLLLPFLLANRLQRSEKP